MGIFVYSDLDVEIATLLAKKYSSSPSPLTSILQRHMRINHTYARQLAEELWVLGIVKEKNEDS